jgi:hypothetical protein
MVADGYRRTFRVIVRVARRAQVVKLLVKSEALQQQLVGRFAFVGWEEIERRRKAVQRRQEILLILKREIVEVFEIGPQFVGTGP